MQTYAGSISVSASVCNAFGRMKPAGYSGAGRIAALYCANRELPKAQPGPATALFNRTHAAPQALNKWVRLPYYASTLPNGPTAAEVPR